MSEVSEVLERAAKLIEIDGWCQGAGRVGSRHCLANAIDHAAATDRMERRAYQAVANCVHGSAILWNDTPGRTKQEVIDKLREAAEASR